MKLHRIRVIHPHEGTCYVWCRTQLEVAQQKREIKDTLMAGLDKDALTVERVEVPTDKAGLAAWLNAHFNRNNG